MNRHAINRAISLLALALSACVHSALAQTTQEQAFAEGKAYKPANAGIRNGIEPNALAQVPGQDGATTSDLTGLYGANLAAAGQDKVAACAAYVPSTDGYKNAECDTINYVVRNPGERPSYTIDKQNDPLIVRGNEVRSAPQTHTAGMSGLSGNYTACTEKTTSTPERFQTERCDIDRVVTETQCSATLSVTHSWQPYSNQPGADLRYGRCAPGQVRGDSLALPITSTYRTESGSCADFGHGTGVEVTIRHRDCAGNDVRHGYDASACTAPPTPARLDPPRAPAQTCADAPRTSDNCFTPDGRYAAKASVPVFQDRWDDSACAALNNGPAITQ